MSANKVMHLKRFENKVAFITGGTSGIGRESALAIAREGAHVMLADLNEDHGLLTKIQSLDVSVGCYATAVFVRFVDRTHRIKSDR